MRPIVALHGYGAGPDAFDAWRARLAALGRGESYASHYWTQSDDVGLHDLAEGFDRALTLHPALGHERSFDAIVHSTGMLVLRAWLAAQPSRRERLGAVVALAPAGFGSPLAHLGRGMLGALFAGDRRIGPDFLEAGDRVLAALELASAEAWRLADEIVPKTLVACGTDGYPFPLSVAHPQGSDGVVRFAGCEPDAPLTTLDLRRGIDDEQRVAVTPRLREVQGVVPVPGRNHASILSDPPAWLVERAAAHFAGRSNRSVTPPPEGWRQAVVRVEDERGDPVPDYFVDLLVRTEGNHRWRPVRTAHPQVRMDVHVHRDDRSRRCFHLDLADPRLRNASWAVRLLAETGSDRVGYAGHRAPLDVEEARPAARWSAAFELGHPWRDAMTERLLVRLDREPLPFEGRNRLVEVAATHPP